MKKLRLRELFKFTVCLLAWFSLSFCLMIPHLVSVSVRLLIFNFALVLFTKPLSETTNTITIELRKFPFGVLAAQPEEVAADLVPKILAQKTNGGIVEFLTTDRVLTKFFERFILQKKSEYIDDDGNVIKVPGEQYDELGVRSLY
mmetsp:Transcript_8874/g.17587  ORF Transcript_8874/g.17587 Transcript_8874/m.17587 type:complete len:145 (+) Transcript_8874:740-1174(+)